MAINVLSKLAIKAAIRKQELTLRKSATRAWNQRKDKKPYNATVMLDREAFIKKYIAEHKQKALSKFKATKASLEVDNKRKQKALDKLLYERTHRRVRLQKVKK